MKSNFWKVWESWVKVCLGESVVFLLFIFVFGVFIILLYEKHFLQFLINFTCLFIIFYTRYLHLYIDRNKLKLKNKR